MKNDSPGAIPVTIAGETRYLKLGPKALRLARDRHGVKVKLMDLMDPDLDTLMRITWVACLPDSPDTKEDEFLDALDESGDMLNVLTYTAQALTRLTEGAKPKRKTSAGKGQPG